ncbi:zinc finger protein 185 isoform X2 [Scophthalmus maximus]|uniref:zinc finger protein 185 isoform X2 n=1 Tax=Scophthalmus maximus TaxID=52904 RepID=UPI001FA82512|nr:zinc finger protein 185 isoform X2 [Scophthalmus maximus]
MSKEGDKASVFRTTKVRTKLKGDGSWLQRRSETEEEEEEVKPWVAEVRASRVNGAPAETSPVPSPTKPTLPPTKPDAERAPTSGYLIRGVFTKLDDKPASSSTSNGVSGATQFNKKPSESYKRIAPHTVRPTSENQGGQFSSEEQEKRTEAASNVLKKSAVRQRSYVFSAAQKYESKEKVPDTSPVKSSASFVAKRVELFDDDEGTKTPTPVSPPSPLPSPVTSVASAPNPRPRKIGETSVTAPVDVAADEPVAPKVQETTPAPVSVPQKDPFGGMKPGCTKVATPLPELLLPVFVEAVNAEPEDSDDSEQADTSLVKLTPALTTLVSTTPAAPAPVSPILTPTVPKSPAPASPFLTPTVPKSPAPAPVSPFLTPTVPKSPAPAPVSPFLTSTVPKSSAPAPASAVLTPTVPKSPAPAPVSPVLTPTVPKSPAPAPVSPVLTPTVPKLPAPAPVSPVLTPTVPKSPAPAPVSPVLTPTVPKSPAPAPVSPVLTPTVPKLPAPAPVSPVLTPTVPKSPAPASAVLTPTVPKSPAPVSPVLTPTVPKSPAPASAVLTPTVPKSPAPASPFLTPTVPKSSAPAPASAVLTPTVPKSPAPAPVSPILTPTVPKSPAPASPFLTPTVQKSSAPAPVSPFLTPTVPKSSAPAPASAVLAPTVPKSPAPAPVSPVLTPTVPKSPAPAPVSPVLTPTGPKSPGLLFAATAITVKTEPEPEKEPEPEPEPESQLSSKPSSSVHALAALYDSLIPFDTTSLKDEEPEQTEEEDEVSANSHATENSVATEPALSNCEPITDDLLSLDDGPEELAEPVPPSPGRWSQDLLSGLDSEADPAKTSGAMDLLANDVIPINTETRSLSMRREEWKPTDETAKEIQSLTETVTVTTKTVIITDRSEEDNSDPWSSRVTTVVTESSSADPFDPYPIGTTSPNSSSDLLQPLEDISINRAPTTFMECKDPSPEVHMIGNTQRSLTDDIIPINTNTTSLSTQRSWARTWETIPPQQINTDESQEPEPENQAGDQQTLIRFERKSSENDSPWDRWTSPTVYTITTGEEDEEEEEEEEEERSPEDTHMQTVTTVTTIREIHSEPEPAMDRHETSYSSTVVEEERRVPTPEPSTKKPFVYVKEYVNATELSSHNARDLMDSGSDYLTSSSTNYSYSSPSAYSRGSLSSACTFCGEQVGNDAKITIEHLNINCHPDCFKCGVCRKPMGDLLYSMFLHGGKVHCESCYSNASD